MIGFYQSGVGFGGMFGAMFLLGAKAVGMKDWMIYSSAIPLILPFFLLFYWLTLKSKQYVFIPDEDEEQDIIDIVVDEVCIEEIDE